MKRPLETLGGMTALVLLWALFCALLIVWGDI